MDYKKLFYVFSTLSDLGEEIRSVRNFQHTIRTSLHMILGTLSIARGGIFALEETQKNPGLIGR